MHTPSSNPNRKPARQLTLRRQPQNQRNQRGRPGQGNQGMRANPRYPQGGYGDDPPPYPGAPMEMRGGRR